MPFVRFHFGYAVYFGGQPLGDFHFVAFIIGKAEIRLRGNGKASIGAKALLYFFPLFWFVPHLYPQNAICSVFQLRFHFHCECADCVESTSEGGFSWLGVNLREFSFDFGGKTDDTEKLVVERL